MPTATVTSKGQVTLPKRVREMLRVEAGDQVDFVVDRNGRVVVQAAHADVSELKGLLQRHGRRAVTLDEMQAAIERQHAKRR
jgi:AbrB family looped-hinge helix DNA binding protein